MCVWGLEGKRKRSANVCGGVIRKSVRCEKACVHGQRQWCWNTSTACSVYTSRGHTPWKFNMIDWILHVKGLYVCKVVREGYKMCQLTGHQRSSLLDY